VPTTTRQVLVEYHGVSWQQPSQPLLYETWLQGYEADWQKATRGLRVGYTDLPVGEYTFQVRALDGELNASDPASLHLSIVPDPRLEAWQAAVRQSAPRGEFVGQSAAVQRVLAQLVQAGQTEVTVLLLGETGTGKGLAARTLHEHSGRRDGPLVQVSCGALPEGLVESELFGHERGAFTGAHARQLGKVELAEGGTLFLDEIGDLPLALQGKLLRLLEEHTFERVGGTQTWRATARVVAATNRDLEQMVREQTFRADLYYRLNPFLVRLPPLRERREDLPALVDHFLGPMALHLHKGVRGITAEALEVLKGWSWPGNVRELKNVVERAVIGCKGPLLQVADLGLEREGGTAAERVVEGSEGAWVTLEEHERRYLRQVLAKTGGVIRGANGAAAILGIPESSLRWRLKKLGIEKP
jgi:transcriptional regulator with GAF, ATPase, and Fis domain